MVQLLYRAEDDVIDAVVKWSEDFVEQPHEIFGGLPVCPFARAARIKQTIRFEVRPFALDDPLEPNGDILTLVREFVEETSAGAAGNVVRHSSRSGTGTVQPLGVRRPPQFTDGKR
jgi:hypothetical protein